MASNLNCKRQSVKSKVMSCLIALIVLASLIGGMAGCTTSIRVATTTSLYDTGLWDYLEPKFEEEYGVELDIIYAGTGKALEYGRRGDVDVIVIHSRTHEDKFVAEGYGINRRCFAYNYFLIVGPDDDPAGIKGLSPEEAFRRLMEEGKKNPDQVQFVSRGDDSGTHGKEKAIWRSISYDYEAVRKSGPWYIEAGSGMGPTLVMASEKLAYTISDIGTFLAYKGKLTLIPVVDKGDILLNVYAAIAINPEKHRKTNIEMANNLINFLMSEEVQQVIGEYGVKEYGGQLFIPCARGKCREIGCPTWQECAKPATYQAKD